MNLFFRIVSLFFKLIWIKTPKLSILGKSEVDFRVLPTDCDINFHLTNSRYLSFMDLGRMHLMGKLALIRHFIKNKWSPIVAATDIVYLRPINPWQKFQLTTRMLTWDEKFGYIEQRFKVKGKLHAVAMVKILILDGKKKIPTSEFIRAVGEPVEPPIPPVNVERWKDFLLVEK